MATASVFWRSAPGPAGLARSRPRTSPRRFAAVVESRWIDCSRLRAISGIPDVELELALEAADGDRRVVADDLRGHLQRDLGDDRVDLARHEAIGDLRFALFFC